LPKRKKFKAKELKHDPFRDWYERQAERARLHKEPIRRTMIGFLATIVLLSASGLGYSLWKGAAQTHLARAFDLFNADVTETPPASPAVRTYKTEEEKYRAALEAYQRVSDRWYYKYSGYGETASYYKALCQLHLKPSEGQALLERLAQGHSMTARLARLALAQHVIAQGDGARAETLYRQLIQEPGQLPKPHLQLGLARALELQGKKADAVNLYVEIAKERAQELEGSEAVNRLAVLDPKALDQLPTNPRSPARDALSRYTKK